MLLHRVEFENQDFNYSSAGTSPLNTWHTFNPLLCAPISPWCLW